MKRFLLNVSTEWCGEDNTYAAYAKSEDELYELLDELAYENFSAFGGFEKVLEQLYPNVEEGKYTEEMYNEAESVEHEYYFGDIEEWDETRPEEEWNDYELVYDDDDDEDNIDEEEYA